MEKATHYTIKNVEGRPIGRLSIITSRGYESMLASQLLDQWPGCREVRWENTEAFGSILWGEATSEADIAAAQDEFNARARHS